MKLLKDLADLVNADVITKETAERIRSYYAEKQTPSTNRLFVIFGVLGAILVGLGIVLIVAHNWDELSKTIKTGISFSILVVGQLLCAYALAKKYQKRVWRESTAVFLFFSVGATISLISQIYNIPGDVGAFLLTWMLICLPLIYVMNSSITSLLYLSGITYYASHVGYWSYPTSEPYMYWLLLLGALPHYLLQAKKSPNSNYTIFHHWVMPLSIIVCLGSVAKDAEKLLFVAYMSLFGLYYLIGNSNLLLHQKARNNGYKVLGSLGTIVLLLILSFDWFWEELRNSKTMFSDVIFTPEFAASAIICLLAMSLLFIQSRGKNLSSIKPFDTIFIAFIIVYILGLISSLAVVIINVGILAIGILKIREGSKRQHLGILNFGLLIITTLVILRFFDTDLTFVFKGIMFVSVGIGFFVTNYRLLKKKGSNEK